ncbi:hypothetical protein KDX31_01455 [Amphritea atlantica]|uniref:Secreted protein n=1 Tax=Amphritea atlantica TaxID=355243 RepID=A0ABY5GVB3_9GAMM|nr:hypothetical protein KDX31_01455 [Amphritea atlantica]
MLLLLLVALQPRILPFELLTKQLFSIIESNVSEQLLSDSIDGGDDQPCNITLYLTASLALKPFDFEVNHTDQSCPSSLRWRTPSTRAPPAFS